MPISRCATCTEPDSTHRIRVVDFGGAKLRVWEHREVGKDLPGEFILPVPPAGLSAQEAGYETRTDDPKYFPGFRCRDCRFSTTPDAEEGYCAKLKMDINNRLGCCMYYEARISGHNVRRAVGAARRSAHGDRARGPQASPRVAIRRARKIHQGARRGVGAGKTVVSTVQVVSQVTQAYGFCIRTIPSR